MAEYVVKTVVAVLPLKAGSERYFSRGAIVSDETITEAGIRHALSVDLIAEVIEPASEPTREELEVAAAAESQRIADEQAKADAAEAAKAAGVQFASEQDPPATPAVPAAKARTSK